VQRQPRPARRLPQAAQRDGARRVTIPLTAPIRTISHATAAADAAGATCCIERCITLSDDRKSTPTAASARTPTGCMKYPSPSAAVAPVFRTMCRPAPGMRSPIVRATYRARRRWALNHDAVAALATTELPPRELHVALMLSTVDHEQEDRVWRRRIASADGLIGCAPTARASVSFAVSGSRRLPPLRRDRRCHRR
jgi:hypothetical protein